MDSNHVSEGVIQFPQAFPIKVMGRKQPGLAEAVAAIGVSFDPEFDATTMERRESSAGNYLSLTLTVWATSQEQLDAIYRALTAHPMVKMVL